MCAVLQMKKTKRLLISKKNHRAGPNLFYIFLNKITIITPGSGFRRGKEMTIHADPDQQPLVKVKLYYSNFYISPI